MAPIKACLWISFGLVIGAGVACGGGSSPTDPPSAPSPRDAPTGTYQKPPSTRDTPPSSYQDPNGNGGGPSNCVPCDRNYRCSLTENGQTQSVVVALSSLPGGCGTKDAVLACGGTILDEHGQITGGWSYAGGTLTLTEQDTVANKTVSVVVTCVQTNDSPTPTPTVTGTSTAAPGAPAPTGT
jgi:hypothetical protein